MHGTRELLTSSDEKFCFVAPDCLLSPVRGGVTYNLLGAPKKGIFWGNLLEWLTTTQPLLFWEPPCLENFEGFIVHVRYQKTFLVFTNMFTFCFYFDIFF